MLQQTGVSRVVNMYPEFLGRFGSFEVLARASVGAVLQQWQGMGYNRRVLWLSQGAKIIAGEFGGELPRDERLLRALPGIGPNTAGSIAAFAYDIPTVFIETNIRRVFIHHFPLLQSGYQGGDDTVRAGQSPEVISDNMLLPLIEATVDRQRPREWYYGLMDYGADLAKRVPNPNRRSKHYSVQSTFEGSVRQLQGEVLRQVMKGPITVTELGIKDARLSGVLDALVREGFLICLDKTYSVEE